MDDLVADFATAGTLGEFWLNLGAVLTDEVVLVEAQQAGMDWPDLAEGRRRLGNTRRALVNRAVEHGWVTADESWVLLASDPQESMAAARPWIEREQERTLILDQGA